MRFHAFHGCLERERKDGNIFEVDIEARMDISAAASDNLRDTLDYGEIYAAVAERMSRPSNLLEKVALDLEDIIAERFPMLESFSLTVRKCCPPVGGEVAWAGVTVEHINR